MVSLRKFVPLARRMAAQSDFAKHGAVALSEVAAFDNFVRKCRPSPLSLSSVLDKPLCQVFMPMQKRRCVKPTP
jgi:hypothetical protein